MFSGQRLYKTRSAHSAAAILICCFHSLAWTFNHGMIKPVFFWFCFGVNEPAGQLRLEHMLASLTVAHSLLTLFRVSDVYLDEENHELTSHEYLRQAAFRLQTPGTGKHRLGTCRTSALKRLHSFQPTGLRKRICTMVS